MTPIAPTCPFCNASLSDVLRTDDRTPCPRCGEPLPESVRALLPATTAPVSAADQPAANFAPGKRATLLAILGVMLLTATIGGIFAWQTKDFRRKNDLRTQKKTDPNLQNPAAADLEILGFLPARCNVVAALDVIALRKQASTRGLFEPSASGPLGFLADKLPQWTGLRLSDLDHVVCGAEITDKVPQLIVLVQTRQPYLPGKVAAALAPAQPIQHRKKTLVRFLLKPAGEGMLWCFSDRLMVLVLCLDAAKLDDLDAIPPTPRTGTVGFAAPLRAALDERVPKSSALWLAGHFPQPSALGDLFALAGKKSEWIDLLAQVKTFVVSVQAEESLTLNGHFLPRDVAGASKLQALLERQRWPESKSYKVAGPPPDNSDADAVWVTLQARGDLTAWLGRMGKKE